MSLQNQPQAISIIAQVALLNKGQQYHVLICGNLSPDR